MRNAVLMSAILLGSVIPVAADQAKVNPQANARLGALRSGRAPSPYEKLFQARDALTTAVNQETAKAAPRARIVCGMTVIEADPNLDPKMAITPPSGARTRYTIRAIEPPICR